jgi:hypothetical protein
MKRKTQANKLLQQLMNLLLKRKRNLHKLQQEELPLLKCNRWTTNISIWLLMLTIQRRLNQTMMTSQEQQGVCSSRCSNNNSRRWLGQQMMRMKKKMILNCHQEPIMLLNMQTYLCHRK